MDVADIRAGDESALDLLLEEAWAPLVLYLSGLLDSREAAEDAAQESFVRLWEHRERWKAGPARAVVFGIGRNLALDRRRRREVRRRWSEERAAAEQVSPPTPHDEAEREELHRHLDDAVRSLPERRREVFELVRFRGLSYAEAAAVLELSQQTVANQMSLALRDLRHLLAAHLDEPGAPPAPDHRAEGRSQDG